jgi:hypothetical protein
VILASLPLLLALRGGQAVTDNAKQGDKKGEDGSDHARLFGMK